MSDWVAKYKAWPMWARITAPAVVGALTIGAVSSSGGEAASTTTTTRTSTEVRLSDAVEIALRTTEAAGLSESQTRTLVRTTCVVAEEGDAEELAQRLVAYDVEASKLKGVLEALGEAAEAFCPDEVANAPDLLNDTYAAGVAILAVTTTTETTTTTTTTLATTTTARGATTTTRPPATTAPPSTTAPPATTTSAPASYVTPGAYCSPAGATGYSSTGVPMTCSTHKCDGTPYDQPRWRKTTC